MSTTNPHPPALIPQADFDEIRALISAARQRAVQAVNTTLIELYWQVGQTISRKIGPAQWGDGVVAQLAGHLARTQPGLRGFTIRNLVRQQARGSGRIRAQPQPVAGADCRLPDATARQGIAPSQAA